jgi:hypothetical protein
MAQSIMTAAGIPFIFIRPEDIPYDRDGRPEHPKPKAKLKPHDDTSVAMDPCTGNFLTGVNPAAGGRARSHSQECVSI